MICFEGFEDNRKKEIEGRRIDRYKTNRQKIKRQIDRAHRLLRAWSVELEKKPNPQLYPTPTFSLLAMA